MSFFRLLMVLVLVPVTAWSGMPHVACRCSNGDVRFSCPQLGTAKLSTSSVVTQSNVCKTSVKKSCCHPKNASQTSAKSNAKKPSGGYCATSCHCTPLYLQAELSPNLKKNCLPGAMQSVFVASLPVAIDYEQCVPEHKVYIDTGGHVPADIVILFERFLI